MVVKALRNGCLFSVWPFRSQPFDSLVVKQLKALDIRVFNP